MRQSHLATVIKSKPPGGCFAVRGFASQRLGYLPRPDLVVPLLQRHPETRLGQATCHKRESSSSVVCTAEAGKPLRRAVSGADRNTPVTREQGPNTTIARNLLLGTAAGLIAVAGAQAADMPVKAKPVEYVKVCSLYGTGFYYIPGPIPASRSAALCVSRVEAQFERRNHCRFRWRTDRVGSLRPSRYQRHQLSGPRSNRVRCAHANRLRHPAVLYPRRLGPVHAIVRCGRPRHATYGAATCLAGGIARSFSSRALRSVAASRSSTSSPTAAPTHTSSPHHRRHALLAVGPLGLHGAVRQRRVLHAVAGRSDRSLQVRHVRHHSRLAGPLTAGFRDRQRLGHIIRAATTTASAFRTSSPTCASTRPGAISGSAP